MGREVGGILEELEKKTVINILYEKYLFLVLKKKEHEVSELKG